MADLIKLTERDRGRVKAHLLALEPEARWRRFLGGMADSSIERYVEGLGQPRDLLIGAPAAGERPALAGLLGLAHAAMLMHEGLCTAEIGLSVLAPARGRGLGRQLLRRAMDEARRLGAQRVWLLFSADNRPMEALAKSAGAARLAGTSVRQALIDLHAPLHALSQPAPWGAPLSRASGEPARARNHGRCASARGSLAGDR